MIHHFVSMKFFVAYILFAIFSVQNASAQLPQTQLLSLFPAGGSQGTSFEVKVVDGVDLDELESLYFSHPGISASLLSETSGKPALKEVRFQVKINLDVPPGIYDVRAKGFFGLSNPRSFVVGDLNELFEKEPNDAFEQANVVSINSTVNGTIQKASDVDHFEFVGKKGQGLILDCSAARIDSPLVSVMQLFSPDGKRLLNARDNVQEDPLASVVLPVDGKYTIKVFDLTYTGGKQSQYRLSVHTKPHVDFIMPPSGVAGSTATYTLYGRNFPGGQPTNFQVDSIPLQKVDVQITLPEAIESTNAIVNAKPHQMGVLSSPYIWNSPAGSSNTQQIFFSQIKPVLEKENVEAMISVPGEFVGHFQSINDVDSFRFIGKAKAKYSIEVFGHRLGSPTDPFLLVEQVIKAADGKESFKRITYTGETNVGSSVGGLFFNTQCDDPFYLMTAPTDAEYRVSVHDLYFQTYGDPRAVYRVVVKDTKPDFQLVALPLNSNAPNKGGIPSSVILRKGSSAKVSVMIHRKFGFNGTVDLSVQGLPAGVYCRGTSIASKEKSAILVVESNSDAKIWTGDIKILGRVSSHDVALNSSFNLGERIAQTAAILRPTANMNEPADARLTQGLKLSVINEIASFQVTQDVLKKTVRQGEKIQVPVKVTKQNKFDDKVAITWSGMPRKSKITTKNLTIEKGKDAGNLEVGIAKDTPAGVYVLNLETSASVKYQRNLSSNKKAEKVVQDLAKKISGISNKQSALQKLETDQKAALEVLMKEKKSLELQKKQADKNLVAVKKATAPKKMTVYANAAPLVVRVLPVPFELSLTVPNKGAVKQGESIQIVAKIKRKNNFKGPVEISFVSPKDTEGFEAVSVVIPKDKSDGSLLVKTDTKAVVGESSNFSLEAKCAFQGDFKIESPFLLKINK